MINTKKLQGIMREQGFTLEKLSNAISLSKNGLFNKIHGKREFLCSEMQAIRTIFNLTDSEFEQIFFA